MGEETQAALMQALRDLQEEMNNMRQELGGRMDRIEHRPVIRPQRRVDFGTAQANTTPTGTAPRRTGIHFNDIPEASNTHQQPEDDPGPFYPQNQNQRRTEEQDDYGEEDEEDEDFLPRPRAPRRQNRNQGFEEGDFLPPQRAPRQQNYNQGPGHIKMTAPSYAGKVDPEAYLD